MRRGTGILLPVLWLASAPAAQERAGLDPDDLRLLREAGSFDTDLQREASEMLAEREPTELVATLRRALWSPDEGVARGAAALLDWSLLDVEESERFVDVARRWVFAEHTPFDFAEFREVLGGDAVGSFLADPPPLPRDVFYHVGQMHRLLRAEHVPLLSQLALGDDALTRTDAMRYLAVLAGYTDRFRPHVAGAVLRWVGAVPVDAAVDPTEQAVPTTPRVVELPPDSGGWPPHLVAVLRRLWLEPVDDQLAAFRAWAVRWASEASPGPADADLIVELASSEDASARVIAATSVDPGQILSALCDDADAMVAAVALARSVAAGDEEARVRLVAGAARAETMLLARAAVEPEACADDVAAEAFGGDVAKGLAVLERLDQAWALRARSPLRVPDAFWLRFGSRPELLAADATRLGFVLREFPWLRTEELGRACLSRLQPENVADCPLDLFEVLARDELVARLRAWRGHEQPAVGRAVALALLRLGDEASAAFLTEIVERHRDLDTHLLARTGGDVVRDWLAARIPERLDPGMPSRERDVGPLTTYAVLDGLDERLAREWCEDLVERAESVAASWAGMRERVLRGEPAEAVALWLERRSPADGRFSHLHRLDHRAARAWLERARDEREHRLHAWAVGELALLGDAAARRELERAFHEVRIYSWIDNCESYVLTGDHDLDVVARWLPSLESNCCAFAAIASRLEDAVAFDAFAVPDDACVLRGEAFAEWFERHRTRLRWSRVAGRYVIGG